MPPTSPAATRFTYSRSNTFGCLPSASENVEPLSTSPLIVWITFLKPAFSCCVPRMSRHCTSGRPASIIVANWRVKMTRSRIETPFCRNGKISESSLGLGFTVVGVMACERRVAIAASTPSATITPFFESPSRVLPTQLYVGMVASRSRG